MEGPLSFLDWRNQFCENGHITNSSLQSQCSPYQSSNTDLQRRRNNLSNLLEAQKSLASQTLSKMSNAGVITIPDFK